MGRHAAALCCGALLMECEQRGFSDGEIALLKELEGAADDHGTKRVVGAATKRVAAMRHAKAHQMKLVASQ